MIDLKKENERLRHELAMHKDDNSTKECPGCYMEKVWEKIIGKLLIIIRERLQENHSHHGHMLKVKVKDCEDKICMRLKEALD